MTRPPRVLIADDDRDFLSVVYRFLQRQSQFECLSAVDGMDALRQCLEKSPDALVLDLRLGGRLNGFEVLRLLRADPRTAAIEVVLITGAGLGDACSASAKTGHFAVEIN